MCEQEAARNTTEVVVTQPTIAHQEGMETSLVPKHADQKECTNEHLRTEY